MLYFYQPELATGRPYLEGEEYQHCVKVLRKKVGDEIGVFDGKGGVYQTIITAVSNKECRLDVLSAKKIDTKTFSTHLAIAPTKNMDRLEWLVEKACELGADEISFILTANCERRKIRIDRLEKKAISALKQSKSGFLTKINELQRYEDFLDKAKAAQRYIAVVAPELPYIGELIKPDADTIVIVGPEGDFTKDEVADALKQDFTKVSLGSSVLRTETAGLMSIHFVNMANGY